MYVMMDAHNRACGSRPRQPLVVVLRLLQLLLLLVSRAASANAASPLDGCHHVFLDVGANIGIHSRFLFEPTAFPDASFRKIFDTYFGADRDPSTTCALSFEPNPTHRVHHTRQKKLYARHGWRYEPIASAVGARAGNLTFYSNIRRETQYLSKGNGLRKALGVGFGLADREGAGAGEYSQATAQSGIVRPVVDLAAFLLEAVAGRALPRANASSTRPPAVVVKLDVEGVEFAVAPRLLETRALCAVNFISIEWHTAPKFLPHKLQAADGSPIHIVNSASATATRDNLIAALKRQAAGARCTGHYELSDMDDESYWDYTSFDRSGATRRATFLH